MAMANEDTKEVKSLSQNQDATKDKLADTSKAQSSPSKGATSDQSKSPQKNNNKNDNNTPSSQSKAATPSSGSSSSSTRGSKGVASIDKYNELKKKLTQQILKKQELTNKLSKLEDTIYQKESSYFEESYSGNIVKGFENFSKSSGGGAGASGGGAGSGASGFKRRIVYTEDDHIFSLSSISFVKNMVKRHGAGYVNGSLSNGPATSIINSKDELDDYEDSVDPTTANLGVKSSSQATATTASPAAAAAAAAATVTAAATVSADGAKSETSRSSTPSRKRKARTIED
ncbi:EAF6 [Candida theae]|uniref:Chromatin modification-related protein EAF6 n=1 Tax=Candida theae TaxID=1198502 RepID=A0AAD5BE66_9ASCO|nr:EAF6 [Candida theae]KAI5957957.1 EAF6 [Candida theae]